MTGLNAKMFRTLVQGLAVLVVLAASLVATGPGQAKPVASLFATGPGQAKPGDVLTILVLSNRADLVSGGDALVEIKLPRGVDPEDVEVELNGRKVSDQFAQRKNGHFQGLLTGLRMGTNRLMAKSSLSETATLTITNYSKQGPILAGKQIQPWICETEEFGLGPPIGPACVAPTRVDFFYRSAASGAFETYDTEDPPQDALIATTTTDQDKVVPYIVRRERGVIDRGIYDIAVLFDPRRAWEPWAPQPGWNGKLHFVYSGSSGTVHRQSGPPPVMEERWLRDLPLSKGFAVASSSLFATRNNANDVVAAESTMMLKEHFIEHYGPVRYTTSNGASGGSILQILIAANYPGLIDGLMPWNSFPDYWSMSGVFYDCAQLRRYFAETSPGLWSDGADRRAVQGTGDIECAVLATRFDPQVGCTQRDDTTEPEWVYDPAANPTGARCTLQDAQAPILGYRTREAWSQVEKRIGRGFANRPMDNVGVQYGLRALLDGDITPEQFADMNAKIGGHDIDYNWVPQRSEADLAGLRNAYMSGRIPDYRQLATVPMVEVRRGISDGAHLPIYTRSVRARLVDANGHAGNHVSWKVAPGGPQDDALNQHVYNRAFELLDEWMSRIEADRSNVPLEQKVLRQKPQGAVDKCWIEGMQADCSNLPDHSEPRLVAGSQIALDVVKCRLKPIDWTDYGSVQFTQGQREQLREAFPHGVCGWTKTGVAQRPPAGIWQTFGDTERGPLGHPPHAESKYRR